MLAVAYGHSDAVSLLLEKEANVDAVDIMGCTALHRGVCTSSLALVKQFCSELISSFFFLPPYEFLVRRLLPEITN